MKLTKKQKEMYERLKRYSRIYEFDTVSYESRTLNQLVAKGLAEKSIDDRSWVPIWEEDLEGRK